MYFDPSFSSRYLELPPISTIPGFWTYECPKSTDLHETELLENPNPGGFEVTRTSSPNLIEAKEQEDESDSNASPPASEVLAISRRQRYLRHSMLAGWMARKVKIVRTAGIEGKSVDEYMCKACAELFKFKLQLIQHMRATHKEVRSVSVLYKRFNKVKLEKATSAN